MFLKSFNKFQITLICLSILTIVSLGLFNLSNINSYAESKENPESLVSLELNSNVTLSELNTNLRASVGNIDNLSINSISTKINIGESEQTFTKNNFSTDGQIKNDELSSSKILKQFPKSLKAFSKTLLIMKDKFDSNQESQIGESDTISPLMTKYSKDTLNKIDIKTKKLNSDGINISSISLMGSNNFITRISVNESIKNISRNINVTNLKEIQRQGDELKLKLDKASSEEAKNLIMQIELI